MQRAGLVPTRLTNNPNSPQPKSKAMLQTIFSTDVVDDTYKTALYASICFSEKGYRNEVVETAEGHEVRSEIGIAQFHRKAVS